MKSILFLLCFSTALSAQTKSITLLFAGDIMGHEEQIESATIVENESYDYESCFQYVKPLIEKADIAIANLEVVLPGKPPYQGFPYFKSPDVLARALKKSGFDVLATANNHSNDDNVRGLVHTIDVLRQNKIHQTGTFKNKTERELSYPLIVYKKGFKIAFLNCTFSTNKRRTIPPTIVNMIDEKELKTDLREAKKMKPDAIIVLVHWGKEYALEEHREQEKLAKKLFAWGADLVVGSHPHVIQPIKTVEYRNSDKKKEKGLVVYSLGNFISNQLKLDTDGGILFEVTLKKEESTQKTMIQEATYIPIWRFIKKKKGEKDQFFTIPVAPFENASREIGLGQKDKKAMQIFASRTQKRLEKAPCKEQKITWKELGLE